MSFIAFCMSESCSNKLDWNCDWDRNCMDVCGVLVAAGGVAGESSSCRRNVALLLGSAEVSDEPY